ncbi:UNVERIFIED_CONTAM: hypothetical protein K2H54_058875 [Gekko kuhli]
MSAQKCVCVGVEVCLSPPVGLKSYEDPFCRSTGWCLRQKPEPFSTSNRGGFGGKWKKGEILPTLFGSKHVAAALKLDAESPFTSSYGVTGWEPVLWRERAKPPKAPVPASSPMFISSAGTYMVGREAPAAVVFLTLHEPPSLPLNRQMRLRLAVVAAAAAEFYGCIKSFRTVMSTDCH